MWQDHLLFILCTFLLPGFSFNSEHVFFQLQWTKIKIFRKKHVQWTPLFLINGAKNSLCSTKICPRASFLPYNGLMPLGSGLYWRIRHSELGAMFQAFVHTVPSSNAIPIFTTCLVHKHLSQLRLLSLFLWTTLHPRKHNCPSSVHHCGYLPYGEVYPCVCLRLPPSLESRGYASQQALKKQQNKTCHLPTVSLPVVCPVCHICHF